MKGEFFRKMSLETIPNEIQLVHNRTKKKEEVIEEKEDYLVKTIGAFGLWQGIVAITVTLTRAIAIWNMMAIVFLTPNTEFICAEFSANITGEVEPYTCYDDCITYKYTSVVGKTNIIEDFHLICQDTWLASFTQSILMFGLLIGVSLFGWISDRFGRRIALILSTLINAIFMVALPFSPNYIIFTSVRFIIGVATGGSLIICMVHMMEIIGKQYREIAGALGLLPDGFAEASLAGFAYYTSGWRGYSMSYGVATCIIFVLIVFVPESPRWLMANGRVDEAIDVVTRAAIRNKLDTSNIRDIITKAAEEMKLLNKDAVKTTYLDFFKTKEMCVRTILVFVIWLACGICFYGIYQYLTLIGLHAYITVIVTGLVQVPLCPLGIILNRMYGRKISTVVTTCLIGITMLILIFVPQGHWVGSMLGVIGFSAGSIAFAISYIYVTELFPTPLRNMAFGISSGGAKVGAMIAPFIANLWPRWLASLIFGIVPFVSAICCLYLPETKGLNLRDLVGNGK